MIQEAGGSMSNYLGHEEADCRLREPWLRLLRWLHLEYHVFSRIPFKKDGPTAKLNSMCVALCVCDLCCCLCDGLKVNYGSVARARVAAAVDVLHRPYACGLCPVRQCSPITVVSLERGSFVGIMLLGYCTLCRLRTARWRERGVGANRSDLIICCVTPCALHSTHRDSHFRNSAW